MGVKLYKWDKACVNCQHQRCSRDTANLPSLFRRATEGFLTRAWPMANVKPGFGLFSLWRTRETASVAAAAADAEPCHGKGGFALVFHIFTASCTAPLSFSAMGTESVWHEDKSRTEECQAAVVMPAELLMVDFRDTRFMWAPLALDLKQSSFKLPWGNNK